MKRLASALLVVFALNTDLPVIEEIRPAPPVVQPQPPPPPDVQDAIDTRKDRIDGPGPSGDGGGYRPTADSDIRRR